MKEEFFDFLKLLIHFMGAFCGVIAFLLIFIGYMNETTKGE